MLPTLTRVLCANEHVQEFLIIEAHNNNVGIVVIFGDNISTQSAKRVRYIMRFCRFGFILRKLILNCSATVLSIRFHIVVDNIIE